MDAFKPYRFLIFDRHYKNHSIHSLLLNYLERSLLCKEVYINDTFSKWSFGRNFQNKLVYYSSTEFFKGFKQDKDLDVVKENKKWNGVSKNEIAKNSVSVNMENKNSKKKNNTNRNDNGNDNILNLEPAEKKEQGKTNWVTLFIYDKYNKEEFKHFLIMNKQLSVNHVNVLCLHNCNEVQKAIQNYVFNRVSIFTPYYIIFDNEAKHFRKKLMDTLYIIFTNFLPLKYKSVYISDLLRSIILNVELCQQKSDRSVEILSFLDLMEILGKV